MKSEEKMQIRGICQDRNVQILIDIGRMLLSIGRTKRSSSDGSSNTAVSAFLNK